ADDRGRAEQVLWRAHRRAEGAVQPDEHPDGVAVPLLRTATCLRHSGAMRSIEPGISRFRVRPSGRPGMTVQAGRICLCDTLASTERNAYAPVLAFFAAIWCRAQRAF